MADTTAAPMEQTLDSPPVRLLLVEDQLIVVEALRRMLGDQPGIELHYETEAAKSLHTAQQLQPAVILQDLVMPGLDGFAQIQQYRADEGLRQVPVIVLSSKEDPKLKAHSYAVGASDYLVKLPDKLELLARVRCHAEAYVSRLQRDQALRLLQDARQALRQLAALDGQTGIASRRRFDEVLRVEWRRGQREQQPVALLLCRVDRYPQYAAHYGPAAADLCLRKVAAILTEHLRRPADLAARYGGEEFAIILPETPWTGALIVAESCRRHLEQLAIDHPPTGADYACVTMSIGVAGIVPSAAATAEALLQQAGQALHAAQRGGGNRVVNAAEPPGPSSAS